MGGGRIHKCRWGGGAGFTSVGGGGGGRIHKCRWGGGGGQDSQV